MANFIVGGLLLALVAIAAGTLYKDKKAGKTCSGCPGCSGGDGSCGCKK